MNSETPPYSKRRDEMRSALLEERARAMRAEMSPSEKFLWNELRARKLGVRFVRQAVLGDSIADFYCAEKKLVVEVDGLWHRGREALDARRDEKLRRLDVLVVRLTDAEVETSLDVVVRQIRDALART